MSGPLERDGVRVDAPLGWDARLSRREGAPLVLHAANFELPLDVADYGGGAVETMTLADVFVSMIDFGRESATQPLFAAEGVPRFASADFSPNGLQRALPGQSGAQKFFHVAGRAFGVYVVLGSHLLRAALVPEANALLAHVTVS